MPDSTPIPDDPDQPVAEPPLRDDDPLYREGVAELLGVIAYGELSAFERLAEDAALAPTMRDKVELAQMAGVELSHFVMLRDHLEQMGLDPYAVMAPFEDTFSRFHAKTAPSDWWEGLVKAYVGDGLAADFYREIAAYLDVDTRALVLDSLAGTGDSAFVVTRVREAIAADRKVAGRLALWGRRLMGEALSQAQLVAAEHDGLTAVLVGGSDRATGMDLAAIGRMFARMTENHAARMAELGLES